MATATPAAPTLRRCPWSRSSRTSTSPGSSPRPASPANWPHFTAGPGGSGHCQHPDLARALAGQAAKAGLVIRAYRPGRRVDENGERDAVDVTTWDGHGVMTGTGDRISPRAVRRIFPGCDRQAVREVATAWEVTLIDPQWGRNTVLCPFLTHFLNSQQAAPAFHPSTGEGCQQTALRCGGYAATVSRAADAVRGTVPRRDPDSPNRTATFVGSAWSSSTCCRLPCLKRFRQRHSGASPPPAW